MFEFHSRPDETVLEKYKYVRGLKQQGKTKEYLVMLRRFFKSDLWFLMRVGFEWAWLDEELIGHHFIKHVVENWGADILIAMPRGFGKTLPMSAVVVSTILNNPDIAILQVSRTEDNADKFGSFVGSLLMDNALLKSCFGTECVTDGFLPSALKECTAWGQNGYYLPKRKSRLDPTLVCVSMTSAIAGKHPDFIYIDDPTEEENNDTGGWAKTEQRIMGLNVLLGSNGFFVWTGTRWHDSDPLGRAINGTLFGKQGRFRTLLRSCYVDDDPEKGVTYPRKPRWNMPTETGYTLDHLKMLRLPKEEGGLGRFFDAQMRNDPAPRDRADIDINKVNIYDPEELPKTTEVRLVGIETTGGGLLIYKGLIEWLDELKFTMPLCEVSVKRATRADAHTKKDRIVAAVQPIVDRSGLFLQKWMIGDEHSQDGFGYEIRRLGAARHDDIIDAFHLIPTHLVKNIIPQHPDDPADLYISVDLSWSEKNIADWSVLMAVAVDHRAQYWVVDYERFRHTSLSGTYQRILGFYQKMNDPVIQQAQRQRRGRKFPGAWR